MLDNVCPRLVILNPVVCEMLPPLPHSFQVSQGLEGVLCHHRKGVWLKVSSVLAERKPLGQKKILVWVVKHFINKTSLALILHLNELN